MKVQINLSKQAQESVKRITEMSKITATRELAQQLEQMEKAASMPVRDATLQMAKAMEAAQVFKKFDLANIAKRNQQAVNEILESQKLIAEYFKFSHLQAIESLVQNMNRVQSEFSTIANIPSLEFVAASQSVLNTIPRIDFGNLARYSKRVCRK